MEKRSEYTKLEKHTQNGCLKFTAVNIKYLVRDKECMKHRVNKMLQMDGFAAGTRLALSAPFAEAHLHSRTKIPCWSPFLPILLKKAPRHPQ